MDLGPGQQHRAQHVVRDARHSFRRHAGSVSHWRLFEADASVACRCRHALRLRGAGMGHVRAAPPAASVAAAQESFDRARDGDDRDGGLPAGQSLSGALLRSHGEMYTPNLIPARRQSRFISLT